MTTNGLPRWANPDHFAVALLGTTLVVVAVLLGQALLTVRSHELMVEATLEDFAGFAAEQIAAELDATFSTIFLDQITAGRSAHYSWLAGDTSATVPRGRWSLPEGAIALHFSVDGDRVVPRGGALDAETEAWILTEVGAHARDIYPRPAPYALLRSDGPGGTRALAYRKEEAYERVSLYGFVIRFDAFGPTFERALDDTVVLPNSLGRAARPEDLVGVRLVFPHSGEVLFSQSELESTDVVQAQSLVAKGGRMAVQVDLDAARARELVPGARAGLGVPYFVALTVLTLGLLAAAVTLMRRAARLTRLREELVTNLSHDLRTPLAQIRMFSETLLLGRLTLEGERRRSLEIIGQQATNLSDLVDNILLASRREKPPVRPRWTELERLLDDTTASLTPAIDDKHARLTSTVRGAIEAYVDPAALRRIVINLIDNALKYGPRGQVVRVELVNLGEQLEVAVSDEGPGIPRRERGRVWERFRRLDQPDRTVTGAGIGLTVVRDLAERHGGDVRIDDAASGGARVVVTLHTPSAEALAARA